jgi:hypothetical protein
LLENCHFQSAVDRMDELTAARPEMVDFVAPIRQRAMAEIDRQKRMDAARSRQYRAREAAKRQEADERTCPVCGGSMKGKRSDANVCSTKCRMRGHRHRGSLQSLALDPDLKRYKGGISLKSRQGLSEMMQLHPEQFAIFAGKLSR